MMNDNMTIPANRDFSEVSTPADKIMAVARKNASSWHVIYPPKPRDDANDRRPPFRGYDRR